MIYVWKGKWSKFGHGMDFEKSTIGCEVKPWSQLGPDLVIGWSWAKCGHTLDIDWTKLGFWSQIGQNMGDQDCVPAPKIS